MSHTEEVILCQKYFVFIKVFIFKFHVYNAEKVTQSFVEKYPRKQRPVKRNIQNCGEKIDLHIY
jgi:hypothetical protein